MKISKLVQKLLVGDSRTDRQNDDLISTAFFFLRSRLKILELRGEERTEEEAIKDER
jgi:hypothetical protein